MCVCVCVFGCVCLCLCMCVHIPRCFELKKNIRLIKTNNIKSNFQLC